MGASLNLRHGGEVVLMRPVTSTATTEILAEMEALAAQSAESLEQQEAISGLTGEDGAVALLVRTPASETAGAVAATFARITAWARNPEALVVGAVTRDVNGAALSASVVWPDGATGIYTADTVSGTFLGAVDGYHITYDDGADELTFTQPDVTRDLTTGAVSVVPEIEVS